jgi:hypothetical protein
LSKAPTRRCRDFTRRILVTLHDLKKAGAIEKIGRGRGVVWRQIERLLGNANVGF